MKELKLLEREVVKLSFHVGEFIAAEIGKVRSHHIEEKDTNSLVSYVDKKAEEMLVTQLSMFLPGATFITEENTVRSKSSILEWIIDPLDGTNNFLHGIPHFAISIALRQNSEMVLGVILDVMRKECYHAVKASGAYKDGKPLNVSKVISLKDALLATGFPYTNIYDSDPYTDILTYWLKNTRGIRRFGAAALDLAFVADGKFDCFYESFLNIWDVAAGALIVKEAGGSVTDFSGGDNFWSGKNILASNGLLHNDILKIMKLKFENVFHQD